MNRRADSKDAQKIRTEEGKTIIRGQRWTQIGRYQ